MNVKTIFLSVSTLLVAATAGAAPVHIVNVLDGTWNPGPPQTRLLTVKLDREPTDAEKAVLENPRLYIVTEEPGTSSTPIKAVPDQTSVAVLKATKSLMTVRVDIGGTGFGKGVLKIDPAVAGDDVVADRPSFDWFIQAQSSATKLDTDLGLDFDSKNLAVRFSVAASTALYTATKRGFFYGSGDVVRDAFSLSGNLPLKKPSDSDRAGTPVDASGQTANYLNLAFERRAYNGDRITALGAIARVTSTGHGFEGVLHYTPLAKIDMNKGYFVAAEFEGGYRKGDAEWENLNQKAPDSGNLVSRLGAVVEYMPRLGFVNADRSTGLRFFVRARGWLDGYRNASDDFDGRFRYFVDGELFYNFSSQYRVFLRGEQGYFPPDLSRRVGRIFVGVGGSF